MHKTLKLAVSAIAVAVTTMITPAAAQGQGKVVFELVASRFKARLGSLAM
jgi:hypothetical protein